MSSQKNRLALTPAFAREVADLFNAAHERVHDLARRLYEIHDQYVIPSGESKRIGKRAGAYDDDFNKWWEQNRLNDAIGTRSNFSRWAKAGEALKRVAELNHDTKRLPRTVDALFAINQMTDTQIERALQKRNAPNDAHTVINPFATAASLRNYLKQGMHKTKGRTKTKKNTLFATIQFTASPQKMTDAELKRFAEFKNKLREIISSYNNEFIVEFNPKAIKINLMAKNKNKTDVQ